MTGRVRIVPARLATAALAAALTLGTAGEVGAAPAFSDTENYDYNTVSPFARFRSIALGDIDGDGDLDAVLGGSTLGFL